MSIQNAVKQHMSVSAHGSWLKVTATGGNLVLGGNGSGVDSLKDSLHDDEVAFVLLTLRLTLQGIPDQPRHVFIHWKGPACKKMVVVQSNQKYQEALHLLSPNHGQLEAIGKSEFTEEIISKRWDPNAGSHVIN